MYIDLCSLFSDFTYIYVLTGMLTCRPVDQNMLTCQPVNWHAILYYTTQELLKTWIQTKLVTFLVS